MEIAHSAPMVAFEAMLNLTPLHILMSNKRPTILRYGEVLINTFPSLTMPSDYITLVLRFDKVSMPHKSEYLSGQLPPILGQVLYTDGSLINKVAELAFVVRTEA